MTSFKLSSAASVPAPVPPPVGPPPSSPIVAPPGAVAPPGVPATPPGRPPLTGVAATLVTDLTEASRLVSKGIELLDTVPRDDVGSEATKDLRLRIYKTNTAAQSRIEKQLAGNPAEVVSELRRADAHLEDANWQLAKKPSPDGRFDGVDIPGALRDASEGARVLNELLAAAGGSPSTPATPPPGAPVDPPTTPPSTPTAPPSTPPGPPATTPPGPPSPGWPGGGEPEQPTTPPPGGPGGAPPSTPPDGGGAPDPDYPGEDEFPTDDKILNGSSGDT